MNFYLDSILETQDVKTLIEGLGRTIDLNFTRAFVINDVGVTTRTMNNWMNLGLLLNKDRVENSTYRFSFVELIWLNIVRELREYGFSLEKIKKVKEVLLTPLDYMEYYSNLPVEDRKKIIKTLNKLPIKDEKIKKQYIESFEMGINELTSKKETFYFNILSAAIQNFLLIREDVKILVDIEGRAIPFFESDKDNPAYERIFEQSGFDRESYITISMNKFYRKFVQNKNYFNFVKENQMLNENEIHILNLMREGKAKSITIRFKDEKPYMLEITRGKKIEAETRLSEVLVSGGYQDISLKTENGNIVVTNIVTKERLK